MQTLGTEFIALLGLVFPMNPIRQLSSNFLDFQTGACGYDEGNSRALTRGEPVFHRYSGHLPAVAEISTRHLPITKHS